MKWVKRISIYMTILALGAAFVYFFVIKNPASRALNELLTHINKTENISYKDYIMPELHGDPFLEIIADRKIITGHRILGSQKNDQNGIKVNVSLTTGYGAFDAGFVMTKINNRWLVSQFPRANQIGAAVPLWAEERGGGAMEYKVDVAGTPLSCILPSKGDTINTGIPISLILIEDYIAEYQHLIPMHLHRIMSASGEFIEDAVLGYIPVESSLSVYQAVADVSTFLNKDVLPIGISDVTLYHSPSYKNKDLVAYIDPSNMPNDTIRIALNDNEFQGLSHQEVLISSSQGAFIKNLVDNLEYSIEPDEVLTFRHDSKPGSSVYRRGELLGSSHNRWYIIPKNGGNLKINSINRTQSRASGGTVYRGNIEISGNQDGLTIINEVGLEEYLYSVVPSEMPIKFGLESLKVQAIAARSYAVRCFKSRGYASLGAHVDDSVSSQVYNNIEETPIAIQAVEETKGIIPVFGGDVIDARFFSTSCGYTSNFHETWSVDDIFPSAEIPYLVSKPQFPGDVPSLYNEENFKAFIEQKELKGYDLFSPFFRWSLTMKRQQIEAALHKNLPALQKAQPLFVLTRDKDGSFTQNPIPEDIGQLQNIAPVSRGQGGNIMELEVTTTRGIYKIIKELNIRQLLKPVNLVPGEDPIEVLRHDGSAIKDFSILPSAFFYADIHRDSDGNISDVVFTGGGYGHGVGMSQYGVYGLSLLGKTYTEIIEHFYPGTELHNLY
ncbi:MAG TPA: SpoIID/LytB domain-containing protein [Clostridia bacterium]|nr:SpoIID/LytB domain-containing protein [Clostridia bacterium]